MAQKLYELAIQLQGKLDGSLAGAMKTTQGHLKELENRVKDFQERQKKVGRLDAAYAANSEAARKLGGEMLKLKEKQSDISGYQAQRKATAETAKAWLAAKRELKALTAAYGKDKTDQNRKAMQAAAKQAKALEKAYGKNRTTLGKMEEKLSKAGINTRKLGEEQKTLADKLAHATREQERYNAAAERIAKGKVWWSGVTAKAREYAKTAWSAAKWTAGIASAMGYGAFRVTKSVAEAGDAAAKLGKKVRMSAEEVQKLQFVADLSGVKDFSGAMLTMTKNTDMAVKGQGKAVKAFKELRIDPRDLSKAGGAKALLAISQQLQNIRSEAQKTRILQGLFGDQWGEMAELFRQGPKAIQDAMKEAEGYGIVSNESAEKSEEFLDNITRMQRAIGGLKIAIGDELRPIINDIVMKITEWVAQNRELISGKVKEWVEAIRQRLPEIWAGVKKVAEYLGKLIGWATKGVDAVGGFENALSLLATFMMGQKFIGVITSTHQALSGLISAFNTAKGMDPSALPGAAGAAGAAGGAMKTGQFQAGGMGQAVQLAAVGVPLALEVADRYTKAHKAKEDAEFEEADLASQEKYVEAIQKALKTGYEGADISGLSPLYTKLAQSIIDSKQRAFIDSLMPAVQTLNEQNKGEKPVEREDVAEWGKTIAEAMRGSEEALKNLPAQLQGLVQIQMAQTPIAQNARGGHISSPRVSRLAERGPEEVVPLGEADRGVGLSRLFEAAHKMNVPIVDTDTETRVKFPEFPAPSKEASRGAESVTAGGSVSPNISYAPVFNISGENARDVAAQVENANRRSFGELLEAFRHERERFSYATT